MLKPDFQFRRVTEITAQFLKNNSIEALLLDVDNTLSTFRGTEFVDGFEEWRDNLREQGIKLMILSNAKQKRLDIFAKRAKIEGTGMSAKPLPFGYFRAVKKLGTKCENTAIVGDQIFTDILGGSISGIKTILVEPIKLEDSNSFKFKRKLERKLLKKYNMSDGR